MKFKSYVIFFLLFGVLSDLYLLLLYVSEGLGSAFAFRLAGYPKIDLITLT